MPDTMCPPVKYWYEYCQSNRWRGSLYYEKYTTQQINELGRLIRDIRKDLGTGAQYGPYTFKYSPDRIADKKTGIYTDASFELSGHSVHPQPELLNMLQSIK